MRKLRSYLTFTSRWYLLLVLVLTPILLVAGTLLMAELDGYKFSITGVFFYIILDVFTDHWVMGGICSREFPGVAYVQSSVRGIRFFENALLVDMIRRFIWYAVLGISLLLIYVTHVDGAKLSSGNILFYGNMVMICYVFATLGVLVSRYFQNYGASMITAYGAGILVLAGIILIEVVELNILLLLVAELILAIAVSGLLFWNNMRKVRGSYYDQAN